MNSRKRPCRHFRPKPSEHRLLPSQGGATFNWLARLTQGHRLELLALASLLIAVFMLWSPPGCLLEAMIQQAVI